MLKYDSVAELVVEAEKRGLKLSELVLKTQAQIAERTEAEMFAYKVLEYIWNDVCKIGKDDWFDTSAYQTLEDVIEAFVHPKDGESPLSVFKSITF
mgnify:CR=1 FL=1